MSEESLLKARTYSARFLEPGVCKYHDEMIMIPTENLMDIANSFKGSPVCIDHQDLHLMNGEERTEKTVGYVGRVYKGEDGWAWCDYTIDKKKAVDLIEGGCFVSCAYTPTESGNGGTYHNISYDRKILAGEALHLALVDNPRYEGANIIENSKEKKTMKKLFKLLNSKKENRDIHEIDGENTFFEVKDGSEKSAAELIAFYNAKQDEDKKKDMDADKKQNAEDSDDEYEMDGEKVKVSEMAKSHKASKAKKNAEEEIEKKEWKENETKDQEKADKKDKAEDKKENSADVLENKLGEDSFQKLENARFSAKADAPKSNYMSDATKFAAGSAIYGSKSKAK